jgi:hypothetical protein
MHFEEKLTAIINIVEAQYLADEIGKYVDRMNVSVELFENIPYVKVYHMLLSDYEAKMVLEKLNEEIEEELRWKSGIIMDQINYGGNNGRRTD